MNIRIKYSALILVIRKDWKNKIINLIKTVLQIIRHFKFIEENEKNNKIILETSILRLLARSKPFFIIPKKLCKNQKYINKGLIMHYTNHYWIKNPKLRQK